VGLSLLLATSHALADDWLQSGYDAAHRGFNPFEQTLGVASVGSMVKIGTVALAEYVAGSAVVLSGVGTPNGTQDLLFLTSRNGTLFALNAGSLRTVWSHSTEGGAWDLASSPAIDPDRRFVYAFGADGKVHKYSVVDGAESLDQGWPQLVTLKPEVEHGASGLTIGITVEGKRYLYAVVDGYMGDGGDYQGHLTTIDLDSGEQHVFNTLCSDVPVHFINGGAPGINDCESKRSGIWGRPGATFDAETDRVYVATGNGRFDAVLGGFDWGDSVLALPANGSAALGLPLDSYTPSNYQDLEDHDIDLGSGSVAVIGNVPGSDGGRLGVILGKDTIVRLLSLDDLSGAGAPRNVGGELQQIGGNSVCKCSMPQPSVWNAPNGSVWVYVIANRLDAYEVVVDSGTPRLEARWHADISAYPSYVASPVVANGVVYFADHRALAYDAITGKMLWQYETDETGTRSSPTVVNGRLYVVRNGGVDAFAPNAIMADGFDVGVAVF
jgi:outer membrane protein assembly factor BamB